MKIELKISIMCMIMLVCLFPISSFATVQVECKPGTTPWVNIRLTDSFDVCLNMKSVNSSIGGGDLNPHLTTNKDYNAVALLAVSNYGYGISNTGLSIKLNNEGKEDASSSRTYYSTTGNASGVMNLGSNPYVGSIPNVSNTYVQTASLIKEAATRANNNLTSLLSAYSSNSKFVEIIESGIQTYANPTKAVASARDLNIGMGIARSEIPLDATQYWGNNPTTSSGDWRSNYSSAVRVGLFSFSVGSYDYYVWNASQGIVSPHATFRPVLWNS